MDAVAGGLLGAALTAFVTGGFNYLDKRKTAPESKEAKMLDFWVQQVARVEEKQTTELNGIRQSFDEEKIKLETKYNTDISQLRQEQQGNLVANQLHNESLNTELRQMIVQRGEDKLQFQKQIGDLRADFHINNLQIEKEKTEFLTGIFTRFEDLCHTLGGKVNDTTKSNNSTSGINAESTADSNT